MNFAAPTPSDFSSLDPRGFLGFPPSRDDKPIELDGDIVLLTGANGAGKSSLLEAVAFRETGGTHRETLKHLIHPPKTGERKFSLRFDDCLLESDSEGLVASPPSWWQPKPGDTKDRRRHARTVYFHPAYLRELFEEEKPDGAGIIDLLAPAPPAVDKLKRILKDNVSALDSEIANLTQNLGSLSKTEVDQTRRNRRDELSAKVKEWREPLDGHFAKLTGRTVSDAWRGELSNLAESIISSLGERGQNLGVSKLSSPSEILRVVAAAARLAIPARQSTPISSESRPAISRATLDAIGRIAVHDWDNARQILLSRKVVSTGPDPSIQTLREKRDAVRRLRNALGRGESKFPEWIAELRTRTTLWRDIRSAGNPPVPWPASFANWTNEIVQMAESWSSIESEWSEWSARLEDQEKQFSHDLEYSETEAAKLVGFQKLSDVLRPWLDANPTSLTPLSSAPTPTDFVQVIREPAELSVPIQSAAPHPAEKVALACETWSEWERKVEESAAQQRSPEFISRSRNLNRLQELQKAIKTESGTSTKGRLGQLRQEAIRNLLKPLERFLDASADNFRLFDNITPIRLTPDEGERSADRLTLRVGNPPREISQCSSGQRSQLGLLLFLALHYGLRDTYHSRVLCLDEVTSSFDLAQIPRLALLLRQIAYAPQGSAFRRRIFIASHNEAFSQRLAEMLTPPAGNYSLRVVRFTGYDPDAGPLVDSFQMRNSTALNDGNLAYFTHRYGPAAHA